MRIYIMRDGGGVQPGMFIESPMAYFQDPQVGEYSIEITEKTDMKQMAHILRDSIYIIGRDGAGRTTIVPTPHIVSIQIPGASE